MTAPAEQALRARLGIPADAARVLVFSESSHWDTNWLQTSDEYFRNRLEPIFALVLQALERDPGRVYCIESVFFLKLYWERHPEQQARLRALIENRQLRITTASLTTPDTLLPHAESILRDFHLGQAWLRENGLRTAPRTAYFPDNFGHSPHLPSLMRAAGVDAVALTRIDGMYFVGCDWRRKSAFPLKGSTAEVLQKELRTLDFVWRDDDGAEVLCHWNAFTYFQGDMLAHAGIIRWMGKLFGVRWRTRAHVARQIDGYVRQLEPLARTPYLLCPIGMDFNDPIEDLGELLRRYNAERFPQTGTWTVLAGLDDYFELLGCQREKLPALAVDPNPYWTGFYATRPELKQRPHRIARSLMLAENLSAFAPAQVELEASLREGWNNLVLINHHDAITGTSPDRICRDEQHAWLDAAQTAADRALTLAAGDGACDAAEVGPAGRLEVIREGERVVVQTDGVRYELSEACGGCLTSVRYDGEELLSGPGFDLIAHVDDGGLWRLGHEFFGGRFQELDRASAHPAKIEVEQADDGVTLRIQSALCGKPFTRSLVIRAGQPFVQLAVSGSAARRRTVTCRFQVALDPRALEMDTLGGSIERPRERLFKPTFWPVPSVVSLRDATRALHACFEAPSAVSLSPGGALEWIVARNATKERAFGFLPVLAHPIGGTSDGEQTHRAALFTTAAAARPAEIRKRVELAWLTDAHRALRHRADAVVRCDDVGVRIAAAKRADAGQGVIVRLASERCAARTVRLWLDAQAIESAVRCDAREQDLEPLAVDAGQVLVEVSSRLTTVRLVMRR